MRLLSLALDLQPTPLPPFVLLLVPASASAQVSSSWTLPTRLSSTRYGREVSRGCFSYILDIIYKGETLAKFSLPCLAIGGSFLIYLYEYWRFLNLINCGYSP